MKKRLIEVLIAYTDNTWATDYIEIPEDTPDFKIKPLSEELMLDSLKNQDNIALVCLYNIPELES